MIVVAVYTHTSLTSKKVNRKKKHFYRSSNFIHKIRESEAAGDQAIVKMFFIPFKSNIFIVSIKIHTLSNKRE